MITTATGPRKSRRHILMGAALVMAFMIAGSGYAVFKRPDDLRLNLMQRFLVARIVDKWENRLRSLPEEVRPLVDYDLLLNELNLLEQSLVTRVFSINPKELGFKGPFHSTQRPENLVRVEPATYKAGKAWKSTGVQYCPRPSYEDYLKMMASMRKDLGRVLYIESGYRSPGRQAYNFFAYLAKNHDYSLKETARWNAMPGYSEHNDPINNALDFINEDGINGESEGQTALDFANLPEYQWLLEHAAEFNFHLSYPGNNPWGVNFEPWHWHWAKPAAAP